MPKDDSHRHEVASRIEPALTGTVSFVRRRCSRAGCSRSAVATLTYVYTDSTAVVGPLAGRQEPHTYDLCQRHAETLSAPVGWEVIRLAAPEDASPNSDDLLALADAVREVGLSYDQAPEFQAGELAARSGIVELTRRGHLTVLADPDART